MSTTHLDSARASASAFGARHAFANPRDLAACDDVDLVVVSVLSHDHIPAVRAALEVNKPVWCEWPFGRGDGESREVTDLAKSKGITTFIGLQVRFAPVASFVRQLIDGGFIGRTMSAHLYMEMDGFGDPLRARGYTADSKENASVLTIPGGHNIEFLTYVLGDAADVSGLMSNQIKDTYAPDLDRRVEMTSPDQFVASGRLINGALYNVHVVGAAKGVDSPFRMHISGSDGRLLLVGGGLPQEEPLQVFGAQGQAEMQELAIPAEFFPANASLVGPAVAMTRAYDSLPEDLKPATTSLPDFEHGMKLHSLLNSIKRSSETGVRETVE